MSNFAISLNAVLPVYLIMAAGYFSKRLGIIAQKDVGSFNKVAFKIFMPVMLFKKIISSDLQQATKPSMLIFALSIIAFSIVCSILYARFCVKDSLKRGVAIQAIYRSNIAIVGMPVATALSAGGDVGPVAVLMAVSVPIYNVTAVLSLEYYSGKHHSLGQALLEVLKNPLIIGCAAGFAFSLSGLELPESIARAVDSMAAVASPLMIFLLGAFFRFSGIGKNVRELVPLCLLRLIVMPGIALALACMLGFRGMELIALTTLFATPVATSTFTMTQQMGGDAEFAGQIVVLTAVMCSFTLFGWIFILKSLGYM